MLSTKQNQKKKIIIPSVFSRFRLKGGLWIVFLFKVHPCQEHKRDVTKGWKLKSRQPISWNHMQNIKVKSTLIHALTPHQTQFKISKLIPEGYILFIRRCLFGALELKKKKDGGNVQLVAMVWKKQNNVSKQPNAACEPFPAPSHTISPLPL